jgi:hypothetical protein
VDSDALANSDTAVSRTVVHPYILHDAAATRKEWGGCPIGHTVLGIHDCAKAYFTYKWLARASEWRDELSGKENMIHQSEKLTIGDAKLTKQSVPSWGLPGKRRRQKALS